MKFETLIIGGGLAGLMCGIRLQNSGVKCAIISTGQSALHFSSGSFDLLNALPDGTPVTNPVAALAELPAAHPYSKIAGEFKNLAQEAKSQLAQAGIDTSGNPESNVYRITPMGNVKSTWLTKSDFFILPNNENSIGKNILLVNFSGFLDFNLKFVVDGLEARGAKCNIVTVDNIPALNKLRCSPTEMRSTNIARIFEHKENLDMLVSLINSRLGDNDCVALPAVFDLMTGNSVDYLKKMLKLPLSLIATMPPSVPGIRTQQSLKKYFEASGGVVLSGDTVTKAEIKDGKVVKVYTANHVDFAFEADNFVLATGSFFSKGLKATPSGIVETVFGADIDASANRADWYDASFFNPQNYMSYGVATDEQFRVMKNGKPMENLYAIGSVLSGFNPLQQGCGSGVSMLTALFVADNLKKLR